MSRLILNERGRVLVTHNEEITRWRWARKTLRVPAAAAGDAADLWLLLYEYPDNRYPLRVSMNGETELTLPAGSSPESAYPRFWAWRSLPVPAGALRPGDNELVLACDAPAMHAWALGLESGHRSPGSALSTDRGGSWRQDHMGAHGVLRGEYVARLRLHSDRVKEPKPPPIVYEDADHPRVRELLGLVPDEVRATDDPWGQALALRTWVCRAWGHDALGRVYAPWDPWTILDWSAREGGHGHKTKIAMCVHFAALYSALLTALGHKARCVVNTPDINSPSGHFVSEVWDEARSAWVMHDPNLDAHFEDAGRPLSAADLADRAHRGLDAAAILRLGPGFASQPPHIEAFRRNVVEPGRGWKHTAIWRRNDYVSDPAAAPPAHGSMTYCETDLIWYAPNDEARLPMFPYHATSRAYFDRSAPRTMATAGA